MFVHVSKPDFDIFCEVEKRAVECGWAAVWDEGFRMSLDQIVQVHVAVRVNINRADSAASQHDLAPLGTPTRLLVARNTRDNPHVTK
jgi:hypothetical protein